MLYEATLETFEEAFLRIQGTLTPLKELTYRKDLYTRDAIDKLSSSPDSVEEIKKCLVKIYEVEKEIEKELRGLAVFLDMQNNEVHEDVSNFKEMVFRAAIKNKLENISYFVNAEIYEKEDDLSMDS